MSSTPEFKKDRIVLESTPRHRTLTLAICCTGTFIVGVDLNIVNVALPSIRNDLHASVSGLQWTTDAYTLVLAALVMLSGSTADRIGRRRTFQAGLVLFTLGSLACSLAPSLGWLVAFRMLQAAGGSMINPVAMSIITNTFHDQQERARAIGLWGGVNGVAMALGPVLGGVLVDSVGWRSIFWVNIPVGIAVIALTAKFVPESKAPVARRADPVAQVLIAISLVSLIYGVIEGPQAGWSSAGIIAVLALSAAALAGLVLHESRRTEPVIDLRFFRSAPFSGATVIAVCGFAAMAGYMFLNTLYLQEVRGFTPLHAGLYILPIAVMSAVAAPLSGRIVARHGPRLPLLAAGAGICAGSVLLVNLTAHSPDALLFASYALIGFGFGMVNAPITNTAVSGMPRAQAGVASAVASTSRQVGATLGVAVVGSAAASGGTVDVTGWWIISGCGAAVLLIGAATTGKWARETAVRTTRLFDTPDLPQDKKAATRQ